MDDRLTDRPRTVADSIPQRSPLQRDLVQLLAAALGGDAITVRAAPCGEAAGQGWLRLATPHLLLRPVDDARPMHAERLDETAALLDAVGDLIDRVEQRTGLLFEPLDFVAAPSPDSICLTLNDNHNAITLAVDPAFAIPRSLRDAAAEAPRASGGLQQGQIILRGPTVPIGDAAALDRGDILLLGAGAIDAQASFGKTLLTVQLNAATGALRAVPTWGDAGPMSDTNTAEPREFSVPIAVELPDCALSPADIANLSAGSIIDLAPVRDGLPVLLRIGGRLFARGQIVRVGETYGVEIVDKLTEPAPKPAARPAPPIAETDLPSQSPEPQAGEDDAA